MSAKFKGKSERGLYGDVIMEIDWAVGEILGALKKNGLDENTLVIFTSDNGPWLSYGNHAGSAGPLREGKGTTFEAGSASRSSRAGRGKSPPTASAAEPAMTIDLLPTIAKLTGAKLPEHKIDGLDIWPLLAGDSSAKNPHEAYFFYYGAERTAGRAQRRLEALLPAQRAQHARAGAGQGRHPRQIQAAPRRAGALQPRRRPRRNAERRGGESGSRAAPRKRSRKKPATTWATRSRSASAKARASPVAGHRRAVIDGRPQSALACGDDGTSLHLLTILPSASSFLNAEEQ